MPHPCDTAFFVLRLQRGSPEFFAHFLKEREELFNRCLVRDDGLLPSVVVVERAGERIAPDHAVPLRECGEVQRFAEIIDLLPDFSVGRGRSEERRVGKECRL